MAFIYFDGLDLYASATDMKEACRDLLTFFGSGPWIAGRDFSYAGTGRFGPGSNFINFFQGGIPWRFGEVTRTGFGVKTDLWVGFAFYNAGSTANETVVSLMSSGGPEAILTYSGDTKTWKVIKGNNSSTLCSTNSINMGVSGNGQWHFIELRYKFGTTDGAIEFWADNVQYANVTNINTITYGNDNGITGVRFGMDEVHVTSYATYAFNCAFDDIYILDTTGNAPTNTRLGDLRIYPLNMNSDAGPNNGAPSTGNTHYSVVSDKNYSTFVSIPNGTGNSTMFGHTTVPITATSIIGMNLIGYVSKSDAGSAAGHMKITLPGSSANGASRILLTTSQAFRESFLTDPAGNNWTLSTINNSKIGWEVE